MSARHNVLILSNLWTVASPDHKRSAYTWNFYTRGVRDCYSAYRITGNAQSPGSSWLSLNSLRHCTLSPYYYRRYKVWLWQAHVVTNFVANFMTFWRIHRCSWKYFMVLFRTLLVTVSSTSCPVSSLTSVFRDILALYIRSWYSSCDIVLLHILRCVMWHFTAVADVMTSSSSLSLKSINSYKTLAL